MKLLKPLVLGLTLVAAPLLADSHASGDAEAGERVFAKCKACHSVVADDSEVIVKGGKVGPNLYGVYKRQAGTYEGFKYGDSIVEAGEAGLEWNEADFVAYASDPKKFLAGYLNNKRAKSQMAFKLGDAKDAANVWAYLVSVGPEADAEADATQSN